VNDQRRWINDDEIFNGVYSDGSPQKRLPKRHKLGAGLWRSNAKPDTKKKRLKIKTRDLPKLRKIGKLQSNSFFSPQGSTRRSS
jgi:hypothetical protein